MNPDPKDLIIWNLDSRDLIVWDLDSKDLFFWDLGAGNSDSIFYGTCLYFSNGEIRTGTNNMDFSIQEIHICMHICTYLDYPMHICMALHIWIFPIDKSILLGQFGFTHRRNPNWCQKYRFSHQGNP